MVFLTEFSASFYVGGALWDGSELIINKVAFTGIAAVSCFGRAYASGGEQNHFITNFHAPYGGKLYVVYLVFDLNKDSYVSGSAHRALKYATYFEQSSSTSVYYT